MNKTAPTIKLNWKKKESIPAYALLLYYIFLIVSYAGQKGSTQLMKLIGFSVAGLILILLYLLELPGMRAFLHKKSRWTGIVLLFLLPITSFLIVEVMVSNFNLQMFEKYSFYNLAWYFAITFLIYAITRSTRRTVFLSTIMIYLAAVVNYLVYLFRGNPIIPSDLLAWRTGMSVASNYNVSFSEGYLYATLLLFLMLLCGSKFKQKERNVSITNRLVGFAVYSFFALSLYALFFKTELIDTKIRVIDFFAPKYTYCAYGTAFGFVANMEAMETDPPEGYSAESVNSILSKVPKDNLPAKNQKPNIIAIMNEAYSDLSMLGDYETNMDYHPFTRTLTENTTKGTLYVSVFGGATSDTEYEFLTGNSMAVMPQNCVPYQQFITARTDSLAATLKEQGYYNIAIHPYKASGYKRDLVYPLLGFDEFLSSESFSDPELIRSFISDRESYRKIIDEYEAKSGDKPLFIFNVTMQNHGGYSQDRVFDDAGSIRLTKLPGYPEVEQYLSLLRESDLAFQTLTDYFSKVKEPTMILLFGDHQPVVYSDFHAQKEEELQASAYKEKYEVPFLLWANYDITEDDVDNISANYLSSYLLETAGLQGTIYNQYLQQLRQEVPVMNAHFYIDKEGNCHQYTEETPYSKLIGEYRMVGYNDALDSKEKLTEFYYLGDN